VSVNCAALPEALLESELFGHLKGAFTGASSDRPGLFAEADQGTIFLDEIGEMPLALQAKLLHVLESKSVRPVGATRERAVDARIVAATHKPLRERVRGGTFREDLLYRLDVVSVDLPPLRARREDIPELVGTFFAAARERHPRSPVERLAPGAVAAFLEYPWPGNVRELAHTIERMVVLGRSAEVGVDDIPESIRSVQAVGLLFGSEVEPMRQMQRKYARWALDQCGGHRGRTADRMGIDGKTLARLLSERGDDPDETPGDALR
jgi:two-component system response regulator HydG